MTNMPAIAQDELAEKIKVILDFKDSRGRLLCDLIPQQMYEDIFIRIIMMIVEKEIVIDEPYVYQPFKWEVIGRNSNH